MQILENLDTKGGTIVVKFVQSLFAQTMFTFHSTQCATDWTD